MGIYSNIILPQLYEVIMTGDLLRDLRIQALKSTSGDTLEIGIGTGLNLPLYPKGVSTITAIDPNPGMTKKIKKRALLAPVPPKVITGSAEKMPFKENTFDSVISTLTLCSIPNVQEALSEIHRVLKPGGHFLYIEHGLSPEKNVQKWQHRLTPLQKIIGDGCHLNRPIKELILKAGLQPIDTSEYYLKNAPKFVGYIYQGIAKK